MISRLLGIGDLILVAGTIEESVLVAFCQFFFVQLSQRFGDVANRATELTLKAIEERFELHQRHINVNAHFFARLASYDLKME